MKKLAAIAAMIATVVLVSAAYVVAEAAETGDQKEALIVQNSNGEYVGTISNALMDPSGNIRFIIVLIDDQMGQGKKEIAVPTGSFSTNAEKRLILDVSKDKLAAAPEFKDSDLNDPEFAGRVQRYFGLVPSWGEEDQGEDM